MSSPQRNSIQSRQFGNRKCQHLFEHYRSRLGLKNHHLLSFSLFLYGCHGWRVDRHKSNKSKHSMESTNLVSVDGQSQQHPKFRCCYASAPGRVKPRVTRINRPLLYNTRGADLKKKSRARETDVNIDSSDLFIGHTLHHRDAAMRWIFSPARFVELSVVLFISYFRVFRRTI